MFGLISSCRAAPARLLTQQPAHTVVVRRFAHTKRKTKPLRNTKQHVVLAQDIEGLGYSGQVVTVAGGYFRNMLYPRGLAKYASRADIALTEETQKQIDDERRGSSEYDRLVQRMVNIMTMEPLRLQRAPEVAFKVTADHIARTMERQWRLRLNPAAVEMAESIKEYGTHPVHIVVDENTRATVQVYVSKKTVDPEGLKILFKRERARAAKLDAM